MVKILYSPGYGAGWSTWMCDMDGTDDEFTKWVLTYAPLIAAVEKGEKIGPHHPALVSFELEAKERFNQDPYTGGACDLAIRKVNGPFRIDEYDGAESVIEQSGEHYITL